MGEIPEALAAKIRRLAGPAAAAISERIRSERRPEGMERLIRLIDQALELIQRGASRAASIPSQMLLTILDCAAREDNELRHNAWVALLANAALLPDEFAASPRYAEIMMQLSPVESIFVLSLIDFIGQRYGIDPASPRFSASQSVMLGTDADLLIRYLKLGLGRPTATREQALRNIPGDLKDFMGVLDHLERIGLIFYCLEDEAPGWGTSSGVQGMDPVRIYHLTMPGYRFLQACQIPTLNRR
jgi:hypothetical protein